VTRGAPLNGIASATGRAQEAPAPVAEYQEPSVSVLTVVAADAFRCAHCGRAMPAPRDRRGLRRRFCCSAHREAARLRRERGLPESFPAQPNRHGRSRLADRCREAS